MLIASKFPTKKPLFFLSVALYILLCGVPTYGNSDMALPNCLRTSAAGGQDQIFRFVLSWGFGPASLCMPRQPLCPLSYRGYCLISRLFYAIIRTASFRCNNFFSFRTMSTLICFMLRWVTRGLVCRFFFPKL